MEAIVNNLIKATGWSIFHSLWQGVVIYGVLMLTVAAIPRLSAKGRHNLAYAAMCLMFTGFCITFFYLFRLPADGISTAGDQQPAIAEPAVYLLNLPGEISSRAEHIFPYLVTAYITGLLFQLLVLGAGFRKLVKLKKACHSAVPAEWQGVFEYLKMTMGLRRKIGFYLSATVNVPLVIGYFKPVVLFPVALASQLDMKQVEAILIHELSHIRRNDYLLNLIKTVIETVLFFNPFIWLSGRFIHIEREHACDDLVLKFTGAPVSYAHALLKLEIIKDKSFPALSLAATGKNQHLYQRIKRITNMKTNYMNAKQQLLVLTLGAATLLSVAWISPAATSAEKQPAVKNIDAGSQQAAKLKMLDIAEARAAAMIECKLTDTSKKKKKFKIVTVDASGEKKEYDSLKEMPESLREEVVSETFFNNHDFKFDFKIDSAIEAGMAYIKSDDFKKQLKEAQLSAVAMAKKFRSADWKVQQAEMKKHAEEMHKKFDSPEFKKQLKEAQMQAQRLSKKFNSPEWKKQQEDISKRAEEMRRKFDSPEFRKQMEDIKKLHESPEYKELKEKFDKDIQKLKEEKGIKSDLRSLNISPSGNMDELIITPGMVSEDMVKVFKFN